MPGLQVLLKHMALIFRMLTKRMRLVVVVQQIGHCLGWEDEIWADSRRRTRILKIKGNSKTYMVHYGSSLCSHNRSHDSRLVGLYVKYWLALLRNYDLLASDDFLVYRSFQVVCAFSEKSPLKYLCMGSDGIPRLSMTLNHLSLKDLKVLIRDFNKGHCSQ